MIFPASPNVRGGQPSTGPAVMIFYKWAQLLLKTAVVGMEDTLDL